MSSSSCFVLARSHCSEAWSFTQHHCFCWSWHSLCTGSHPDAHWLRDVSTRPTGTNKKKWFSICFQSTGLETIPMICHASVSQSLLFSVNVFTLHHVELPKHMHCELIGKWFVLRPVDCVRPLLNFNKLCMGMTLWSHANHAQLLFLSWQLNKQFGSLTNLWITCEFCHDALERCQEEGVGSWLSCTTESVVTLVREKSQAAIIPKLNWKQCEDQQQKTDNFLCVVKTTLFETIPTIHHESVHLCWEENQCWQWHPNTPTPALKAATNLSFRFHFSSCFWWSFKCLHKKDLDLCILHENSVLCLRNTWDWHATMMDLRMFFNIRQSCLVVTAWSAKWEHCGFEKPTLLAQVVPCACNFVPQNKNGVFEKHVLLRWFSSFQCS